MNAKLFRGLAAALLSATLLGCGSGTQGDLSGTGFHKRGEVSGFGSVIVDGQRFATGGARFDIDGEIGDEQALEVGMIVTLQVGAAGNLQVLEFDPSLSGPVEAIADDSLTVAGQTVLVDALTTFEQGGLEDIQVGGQVRVSAYAGAGDTWLASFVGVGPSGQTALEGRVANLDSAAQTFRLAAATVDYSQAGEFDVADDLSNGDLVAVSGSYDAQSRRMTARRVAALDRVPVRQAGRALQWAGIVSNLGETDFQLDDLTVHLDATTQFERGAREDLRDGSKLAVSGELMASGALRARLVRLQPEVTVEFEAEVQAVDPAGGEITLLDGQLVTVAADARLRDASTQAQRRFDLQSVQVGDRVLVSGFESGEIVVALRLERRDGDADGASARTRVRGRIRSLEQTGRQVVLPGTSVQIDDATRFEGYADEADFFKRAQAGDVITAEGRYDDSSQLLRAAVISSELHSRGPAGPR